MSLSEIGDYCSIVSLLLTFVIGTKVIKISNKLNQKIDGDKNITSGKNTKIKY